LPGHKGRIYDVVFKPNQAAIASGSRDKTIKLWQLNNKIITRFYGHTGRVYDVIFSPDDQLIASAGRDKTIKLWNRQGKLLRTFPEHTDPNNIIGHTDAIEKLTFSPDGKLIASASWDKTIKIWKVTGELLRTIPKHTEEVYGIAFTPDGKNIASLSADRTLRIWDLQGNQIQSIDLHGSQVYDLQFSHDGQFLLLAIDTNIQTLERNPGEANTYRLGRKIGNCQILDTNCHAHEDDIEEVTINADSTLIATASRDSTVKVWDLEGYNLYTLWGHEGELEGVNFSADGQKLVSASRDGTLVIWENLPDVALIRQELAKHNQPINYGDFKPESHDDKFMRSSGETVKGKVLRGHQAEVYAGVFSSDGKTLVSASADQTVILWDLHLALNANRLINYGCAWTKNYLTHGDLVQNTALEKKLCDDLPPD
jgi:WD40 repeat protein